MLEEIVYHSSIKSWLIKPEKKDTTLISMSFLLFFAVPKLFIVSCKQHCLQYLLVIDLSAVPKMFASLRYHNKYHMNCHLSFSGFVIISQLMQNRYTGLIMA